LFNYAREGVTFTTSPQTVLAIRLAPSVSNSSVGRLGAKDLLNRSQMLLERIAASMGRGNNSSGEVVIQGIINPKNFSDATWRGLAGEAEGGQPSFAQVADGPDITWSSGTYAVPGERIFSFVGGVARTEAITSELDLSKLKEMSGAPLGGDFKYPDGPDVLCVNVFMVAGEGIGTIQLNWAEAQA